MSETAVLVFARSPVPGQVKTRLMPGLSAFQAAALQVRMIERMLAAARESALGPVILCCTPSQSCPALGELARRHGASTAGQVAGDLGRRMHHALVDALERHPRALLVGTDCPWLDAVVLRRAERCLGDGAPVVLVPAVDGGYVLVGCAGPCEGMFQGVPWGGPAVMATTRHRLRALGVEWAELPPLRDVDRVQDLDLVPRDLMFAAGAPKF